MRVTEGFRRLALTVGAVALAYGLFHAWLSIEREASFRATAPELTPPEWWWYAVVLSPAIIGAVAAYATTRILG